MPWSIIPLPTWKIILNVSLSLSLWTNKTDKSFSARPCNGGLKNDCLISILSNIDLMTVLNYIYVVEIGVNYKTDRKYWKKIRLMRLLVAEWSLKMMLWIIWLHLCNTNTSIKVIMTSFSREIAAGNALDFIHIFKIIMPKVNS